MGRPWINGLLLCFFSRWIFSIVSRGEIAQSIHPSEGGILAGVFVGLFVSLLFEHWIVDLDDSERENKRTIQER